MKHKHIELQNLTPYSIFQRILKASIFWNATSDQTLVENVTCVESNRTERSMESALADDMLMLKIDKMESSEHKADLELLGTIAHAFHYCSITILGFLLIEVSWSSPQSRQAGKARSPFYLSSHVQGPFISRAGRVKRFVQGEF